MSAPRPGCRPYAKRLFTFQSPLLPAARRICHRFVSWLFNLLPELPLWRQRASGPVAAYVAQRSHADETVLNFLIAVMFVHGEHLAAIGAAVFNLHPACLLKHQSNRPLTKSGGRLADAWRPAAVKRRA